MDEDLEADLEANAKVLRDRRAARREGRPTYRTISNWLRQHDDFRIAFEQAHEDGADFDAEKMRDIADDPKLSYAEKRVRISTRQWLATRRNRRRYGDAVELTGSVNNLDDEQQIARLGELLKIALGEEAPGGSKGGA